jgi:copper chaperone CopZ
MSCTEGHVVLKVTGMTCDNCVRHVTQALEQVPGASEVKVDLAAGRAELHLDRASSAPSALVEAVRAAGYEASVEGA